MNKFKANSDGPIDAGRRSLLCGMAGIPLFQMSGCGGGASGHESVVTPLISPASQGADLPIIPMVDGSVDAAGTRNFSLVAQAGTTTFRSGVAAATLGYNGQLLGPALRLRKGENVAMHVQNNLGEDTTVHWHGLLVPAEADGGPHQVIAAGARWTASFTVANAASTCWFHPHAHGSTGRQVVMGLAGLLIVDEAQMARSTLPDTWGVDDLALVLQDKRFTAAGQIDYTLSASDRTNGYTGDVLLVNGALAPVWRAPSQWVRFRLLNGCNARALVLRLGNSLPLLQVANEAGLLAVPVARPSLALGPGERAEVLVDFSAMPAGQEVPLYASTAQGGMGMGNAAGATEVEAMRIRVSLPKQSNSISSPPNTLPAAAAVVAGPGAINRTFRLDGGMMGGAFTINGRSFDIGRIDFSVPANSVEVWTFTNATNMAHPMHVHGVKMSMLTRAALAPPIYEQGLRDTFVVEAMQTVRVAVQTAEVASATPFMFHCHILEHEDAGMMGQFTTL